MCGMPFLYFIIINLLFVDVYHQNFVGDNEITNIKLIIIKKFMFFDYYWASILTASLYEPLFSYRVNKRTGL